MDPAAQLQASLAVASPSPPTVAAIREGASPMSGNQQHPVVASLIFSNRPLSAYGTCFDGARAGRKTIKSLDRQLSSSAGTCGSPVRHKSESGTFGL